MGMSREHLYKAKRIDWMELPKEEWWVEGDLIHEPYGTVIQYQEYEIKKKGIWEKTRKKKRIRVVVYPDTVCEYTGLPDKNGRKIFEEDICKDGDNVVRVLWSDKHQWCIEILKTDSVLSRGLIFPLWQYDHCEQNGNRELELIGSIYDNLELLKEVEVECRKREGVKPDG